MPAIKKAFDLMGDDIVDLSTNNESLIIKIGLYDEKWLKESKAKLLKPTDDEERAILIMSRMQKQMKKQLKMAYIFHIKLCESDFDNIVSTKDKMQDIKIDQIKLEVHDVLKNDEKRTTNFEAVNDEDVLNKAYFDEKISKIEGHSPILEKNYNELKFLNNKQSIEEVLIQRAVKTTIQILYDKGLLDVFRNADGVWRSFCLLQDVNLIRRKLMVIFNEMIHK